MNFLSPDDIFSGVRRKSLCNGALHQLSSKNANGSADSATSTPSKSKKERRRGSFNEQTANGGRRSSLVSRWFKHISDAAEQYKPRSKNANHEPVDDPAIATLPHSSTKESLELTPERPPPLAATATMTTTPLAPMLPLATATSATAYHNNNNDANVQLRRQSSGGRCDGANIPSDSGAYHKQRLSHNELTPASVNRTMSTRSCGETNNNYGADIAGGLNGVTLRHTQSARQANAAGGSIDEQGIGGGAGSSSSGGGAAGPGTADGSKRNSSSIVYSNNSNNTRTLMQSSPPLVEPTAIQISISPAHTAEPVLTPAERLRRLDASIRDGLLEKQKIICDMFRLPVEHFHEIVDIAAMPEAPKDSADIALAAYAQVQSLTEVLNDYMHVTAEQEISAVSTAVCDQCHDKQRQRPVTPSPVSTAATSIATTTQVATATTSFADSPPPLPPPNKQQAQAQQQTPSPAVTKLHTTTLVLDEANIHEDDDGYCEIDELRLPALPPLVNLAATATKAKASSPPPPLPPPAGTFKTPPPPPPPPSAAATSTAATTPELVKRQSTISADSIPEESADEVTQAMDDNPKAAQTAAAAKLSQQAESSSSKVENSTVDTTQENAPNDDISKESDEKTTEKSNDVTDKNDDAVGETTNESTECSDAKPTEPQHQNSVASTTTSSAEEPSTSLNSEHIEINDAYDTLTTLNKLNVALTMVDGMTQTLPMTTATLTSFITNAGTNANGSLLQPLVPHCGPNRIQHANSLEPSVPCHALNSIVSALNAQISLLLPKINERDMERERLRRENQHLRELLNAMHERQRVAEKLETPTDITTSADADDEIDGSSTSITPTPTTPTPATNTNSFTPSTTTTETATTVEAEN